MEKFIVLLNICGMLIGIGAIIYTLTKGKSNMDAIERDYKLNMKVIDLLFKNDFIQPLLKKMEEGLLKFCLDNNIPVISVLNPPSDTDWAGIITYRNVNGKVFDPDIKLNMKFYNIKDGLTAMYIHTLAHEVGHYLELVEKGVTTEDGADLRGAQKAIEYLADEYEIKTLMYGHCSIFGMKREIELEDLMNDTAIRERLLKDIEDFESKLVA